MSSEGPRLLSYEKRHREREEYRPPSVGRSSRLPAHSPSLHFDASREWRPAQRSYSFQRNRHEHVTAARDAPPTSMSNEQYRIRSPQSRRHEYGRFEDVADGYDYSRYNPPMQREESYTAQEYQSEQQLRRDQRVQQYNAPPTTAVNQLEYQSPRSHFYEEMAYNDAIRYGNEPDARETEILDDGSETQLDVYQTGRHLEADEGASSSAEEIDDPEFIEIQERENIIKKYSEGPEGKNIDDWENPDSELFKKMDRFGFLHKDESTLTDEQKAHKRRIELEYRREKKWRAMEQLWRQLRPGQRPKKLEERTWKGIPAKWRMIIWPRLLDVEPLKAARPNTYQDLLLRARLVSKDIKQIDLDINRTYRDHEAFRRRYDVKQQSLLNVLAAYSMYNTEVGYCQGMSQIAALFLMYLDEENAFWCLHSIMVSPRHTMHGFFVPGFPKLTRFEAHFKKVLKKYRPRIYKHLEKQDIPYIYLTKWWFGCFLDRVPFSLAMRLWDVYLIEGESILIAMALNIMKMHEKTIRKLQIDTFMEFIQMQISVDFGFSDDETMFSLRETLTKLKSDRLHIPPPPKEGDLPERPTKALGPVLSKPLGTIRDEIMEIQSRHSLAVSTGRSPYPRRKKSKQKSGSSHNASTSRLPSSNEQAESMNGGFRHNAKEVPFEIPSRLSASPRRNTPSTPPPDPKHSAQNRGNMNGSFPVDSDRSLGGRSSSVRDQRTGKNVTILRAEEDEPEDEVAVKHSRHASSTSTQVSRGPNNVTYISVGDDSVI